MSWEKALVPGWMLPVGTFAFAVGIIWLTTYTLPKWRCEEVGDTTGRAIKYRFLSGCYVRVDDKWIPRDSWRGEQDK